MELIRKHIGTLIYFILVKKIYYAVGQNGSCTLETINVVPNICNPSDYIVYVSESENGCRTSGSKCWCILIDNRNLVYDGDMMIELVQTFDRGNLSPTGNQYNQVISYLTFKIISGVNRFIVQLPPHADTNITSIKIHNNEICRLNNTKTLENLFDQQTTYSNDSPRANDDDSNLQNINLADCMDRNTYTENSFKYCRTTEIPQFVIEKRFTFENHSYWCINIDNINSTLTSENQLRIVYTNPNQYFAYAPQDAYIESKFPDNFQLANRRTVIAISEQDNQLTDLSAVTIDNQNICNYFDPPVQINKPTEIHTTTTSAPVTLAMLPQPTKPTELSIAPNQSINNSNTRSINRKILTRIAQSDKLTKSCGFKSNYRNALISFGSNTNSGDWPWHAAIYRLQTKTANRIFICGGTLINQRTIVTAAHCVIEFNLVVIPERLTVELGRHDLLHASVATQEYLIYDIIKHESYNPDTFENDIALLILANYVQITRYVNFICLPSPNVILLDQVGKTVGWGRDSNDKLQTELKEASFPVVDYNTCLVSNREFFSKYLRSTNFCAGFMNNTNVCRGDSGGGLVFNHKNQWFLGGITSLGVSAKSIDHECDIRQYVIFTDVRNFVTWINRNS